MVASSPALIEKVRTAITDGGRRIRIEDLRPGTYRHLALSGFPPRREGLNISGTGVITINIDMPVSGVQETITVTGETPVVDVLEHAARSRSTTRPCATCRRAQLQLPADDGARADAEHYGRQHRPGIRDLPGAWRPRRRVAAHRRGDEHQQSAGGNQPPNYTADIGNAQEVTVTTSGRSRRGGAGVQMNIVPKQGGNSMSGLFAASGFSKDMQSDNYAEELQALGAGAPNPTYHVYDVNVAVGGPIVRDKLVLHERPPAGVAPQHPERLLQQQRRQPGDVLLRPGLQQPAFYDRHWENYTPRITWQASQKEQVQLLVGRAAGVHRAPARPIQRLAGSVDGAGCRRPRRVQPAARADGALDQPGDEQAAPRSWPRQHLLPVGSPRARSEPGPRPGSYHGQRDHPRRRPA